MKTVSAADFADLTLDELRVSSSARSSNWVWACWLHRAAKVCPCWRRCWSRHAFPRGSVRAM
jgi:hypothetical protein